MPRKGEKLRPIPGDPTDPHGFLALLTDHLEWMRVHNYSPRTIDKRESGLGLFIRWADERGIARPADVSRAILERHQRWLFYQRDRFGKALSFRTQHDRLSALKSFFKWATRQNLIAYNPASELELPRMEKRLPRVILSPSEVAKILDQPNLADPFGIRDRAIMETLYSTGIRRLELVGLKLYDVDPERGSLTVRAGKGRKDRTVPIGDQALAWIGRYLEEVRPQLATEPDDQSLFLSHFGTAMAGHRLTDLVRAYMEGSGIGKRGGCHVFRHAMATHMLDNGADVTFIQRMLGHADISTTQVYTQVSIGKLREIYQATHPAAQLLHLAACDDDAEE